MAKIQIMLGRKIDEVDAWPFLPGIYAHQEAGQPSQEVYSLTHISSKMCVMQGIPEKDLELVRSILGKLLWDRSAEEIFQDYRYLKSVREAELLTNHQRAERQEKRITKDLDGKRQPASGSRWGYRRDVITPTFLVEAKTTKADKFAAPYKDLEFLRKQAYATGRIPVFLISLQDSSEVAVLPAQDVGDEDLPEKCEFRRTTTRSAKHLTVNLEMVSRCREGIIFRVKQGKTNLYIMGYEVFLEFAKKGVD